MAVIGLVEERLPDEILKRAFQVRVNQPVNHGVNQSSLNHLAKCAASFAELYAGSCVPD